MTPSRALPAPAWKPPRCCHTPPPSAALSSACPAAAPEGSNPPPAGRPCTLRCRTAPPHATLPRSRCVDRRPRQAAPRRSCCRRGGRPARGASIRLPRRRWGYRPLPGTPDGEGRWAEVSGVGPIGGRWCQQQLTAQVFDLVRCTCSLRLPSPPSPHLQSLQVSQEGCPVKLLVLCGHSRASAAVEVAEKGCGNQRGERGWAGSGGSDGRLRTASGERRATRHDQPMV